LKGFRNFRSVDGTVSLQLLSWLGVRRGRPLLLFFSFARWEGIKTPSSGRHTHSWPLVTSAALEMVFSKLTPMEYVERAQYLPPEQDLGLIPCNIGISTLLQSDYEHYSSKYGRTFARYRISTSVIKTEGTRRPAYHNPKVNTKMTNAFFVRAICMTQTARTGKRRIT
jgi:hypothetical protein